MSSKIVTYNFNNNIFPSVFYIHNNGINSCIIQTTSDYNTCSEHTHLVCTDGCSNIIIDIYNNNYTMKTIHKKTKSRHFI